MKAAFDNRWGIPKNRYKSPRAFLILPVVVRKS